MTFVQIKDCYYNLDKVVKIEFRGENQVTIVTEHDCEDFECDNLVSLMFNNLTQDEIKQIKDKICHKKN